MGNIVVTTQKVQRGIPLTEAALTTIPYPIKNMDPGTFYTNVSELVGKRPKVDLEAKVPVTSSLVGDSTQGSAAAFQISKGLVAISIPINRLSSVSYAPQAGDHVNIIASMLFVDLDQNFQTVLPNNTAVVTAPGAAPNGPSTVTAGITSPGPSPAGRGETDSSINQPIYVVPSEAQRPRMITQTMLQDVIVLQVGDFALSDAAATAAAPAANPTLTAQQAQQADAPAPAAAQKPDVITLIVTPQDAVTLNYLISQRSINLTDPGLYPTSGAQLTLVLRGAGDDTRVQTEAVTLQYLMDQYNIPVPAKLPYALDPGVRYLTDPWLEQDLPIYQSQPR
jgi:pilus assembly protein CpaB